jgi:TonB family protein
MIRGLGTALTLSALGHGVAVLAIGVTLAWLVGSAPLAPPPPALYVDVVNPVVATSERHEASDAGAAQPRARGSSPGARTAPTRPSEGKPPADAGAARATAPSGPFPEAVEAAASGAPPPPVTRESSKSTSVPETSVPPPPPVPESPKPASAPAASAPPPSPLPPPSASRPSPASPPLAPVPAPAPAPAPTASPPASTSPETASRDPVPASAAAATAITPGPVPSAPSSAPASSATGSTTSVGAQTGEAGGTGASSAASGRSGAALESGSSGPFDPAGGTSVARLTPGGGGESSGSNGSIPPEYEAYVRALRQRVQDRLVYPWTAVRRAQQGVVEVELRVGPDGRLVAVEVVAGPTADALRVAAVSAVRGAAPFPFPAGLPPRPLVIRLPVEFRLR